MDRMIINDEENGIHIDVTMSNDLPKGTAARRFQSILEVVEYHRFQGGKGE